MVSKLWTYVVMFRCAMSVRNSAAQARESLIVSRLAIRYASYVWKSQRVPEDGLLRHFGASVPAFHLFCFLFRFNEETLAFDDAGR
jgi:hypothetical protein